MKDFAKRYNKNIYSQNGEDGIIAECLNRMKKYKGVCVEFGAADGFYCSNTRTLIDNGWNGYMFDVEQKGEVRKAFITPGNVNELIPECDVLSIDIDGNDYNVWKAYKHKPAIVVIEINSSVNPYADEPISSATMGTGFKPMLELGVSKGYFLLCHTGNMIFVDKLYKLLFPEISDDPVKMFNKKWLMNDHV